MRRTAAATMYSVDQPPRGLHGTLGGSGRPSGLAQVEGHAQTGAQRGGDLIDLDESDGQVEGQRMRVASDPQAPMTGIAGGVDDLPDQVAGDTTAAPVRIDEEVLELGTVVLARRDGSEPDDPA